jgi:hypothetical protein
MDERPLPARKKSSRWLLLFLLPFVLILWPGFYNISQPELIGIPFFYWFQVLCVLLAAFVTALLYFSTD